MFQRESKNKKMSRSSSSSRIERLVAALERAALEKDNVALALIREEISLHNKNQETLHEHEQWLDYVAEMVNNVLEGKHLSNIKLSQYLRDLTEKIPTLGELLAEALMNILTTDENAPNEIRRVIIAFLFASVNDECAHSENIARDADEVYLRSSTCLILGISYLEVYCRVNYTGPELSSSECDVFGSLKAEQSSLTCLECDGIYPYSTILLPQSLLLARVFLATIADYRRSLWTHGVILDNEGRALLPPAIDICEGCCAKSQCADCSSRCLIKNISASGYKTSMIDKLNNVDFLPSRFWWSARAAVLHCRMLTSNRHDQLPSLWVESTTMHCASIFMHDKQFRNIISADIDLANISSGKNVLIVSYALIFVFTNR